MLKGKIAVITGASRGIGKTTALAMANLGCNIAVIYNGNSAGAQEVCEQAKTCGVKAIAYQCNAGDVEAVGTTCKKILDDFGSVDILVNNAGITKDNLILKMTEAEFSEVVHVNLNSAFYFIKCLSRSIMRSSCGRIINVTSVSGMMGNAGQANYSAAKAGMIGLTKTVAKEFAARGVTCNAVAPGFIATDMTEQLPETVKKQALDTIPLRRMGTVEEVANVIVFLASDFSSYITGEVIRIDGGICM